MNIWQIAAGQPDLDYPEVFHEYDVMLVGWSYGAYAPDHPAYQPGTEGKQVAYFVTKPRPGDVVLMRLGREAVGIGLVADEEGATTLTAEHDTGFPGYSYRDEFADVKGWDGRHCRRVRWAPKMSGIHDYVCSIGELWEGTRGPPGTFTGVGPKPLQRLGKTPEELADATEKAIQGSPTKQMPTGHSDLDDEEIGQILFDHGLANELVGRTIESLRRAQRLANWYNRWDHSVRPSEYEIVAHQLLPILRALGWSEQLVGVEVPDFNKDSQKRLDLALYRRPERRPADLVMVVEAKKHRESLKDALEQAAGYAQNASNCNLVATTDGQTVSTYVRCGDRWVPRGYVNFAHIRRGLAFHLTKGADDGISHEDSLQTLANLTPGRVWGMAS